MNQKDYKAIAEVIKEVNLPRDATIKGGDYARGIIHTCSIIAKGLADCFERDIVPQHGCLTKREWELWHKEEKPKLFNREQFLKGCGVEK